MKWNKEKSQKLHAIRRYLERSGKQLTSEQYEQLCKKIINGEFNLICVTSNRASIREIDDINTDRKLFAVWDGNRKRISTFLTQKHVDKYLNKKLYDEKLGTPIDWDHFSL